MNFDEARLRAAAPFVLPLLILAGGWMALVRPAAAARTQAARQLDSLRPRLESVRGALALAPPPEITVDPARSFDRRITDGDPGRILEELSRLAPRDRYRNLSIDATGEQGTVSAEGSPQVARGETPDPRVRLFTAQLTYVPVSLSFDAEYAAVGELLWNLRDLATLVEIRSITVTRVNPDAAAGGVDAPAAGSGGDVHVTLRLFAYARVPAVAYAGALPAGTVQ